MRFILSWRICSVRMFRLTPSPTGWAFRATRGPLAQRLNEDMTNRRRNTLTASPSQRREELPRLQAMASKVARVHGEKAPYLSRLDLIVAELSTDLLAHMAKCGRK